ncbi:MAG: L-seryl-tRNA(Sec) selenium transferase [Planctomycetota bacterium]
MDKKTLLRQLPRVDAVLATAEVASMKSQLRADLVDDAVRAEVDLARQTILDEKDPGELDPSSIARHAAARLARLLRPGVQHCLNATGVVLHTGLGRAVYPPAAVEALQRELSGYSVVAVDIENNQRLRRETAVSRLIAMLTGAEAATVVNNNAAATVIALNTMAAGREAILSRGQLVEIGGSFRMPEVFEAAGVTLAEVGTTNRTHLRDYERAINENTGLLLRVHPSNYKVIGFTSEPGIDEMVALGREHGIPVMDDLGAGALVELDPEPPITASIEAGADLITCSGDKLIGGAQSGIILGSKHWIDKVRRNPLFRTYRVDKMTLTVLEATLRLFLEPDGPGDGHPTWRMLRTDPAELKKRAEALAARIAKELPALTVGTRPDFSQVGSGSLPGESLPTTVVTLQHPERNAAQFARALRLGTVPVFTRIVDESVLCDPRTLLHAGEEDELVAALKEIS